MTAQQYNSETLRAAVEEAGRLRRANDKLTEQLAASAEREVRLAERVAELERTLADAKRTNQSLMFDDGRWLANRGALDPEVL